MPVPFTPLGYANDLIERLTLEEPIFHEAYEGFNDQCVFCGVTPGWVGQKYVTEHEPTCVWMEACAYLHLPCDPQVHKIKGEKRFWCKFHEVQEIDEVYYSHCQHCGGENH